MNARAAPHPPLRAPTDRRAVWLMAGLITAVTFIAYHGTFSAPLVLDDLGSINDNPSIRHFSTVWWPPRDLTTTGRPVVNLSLALNYALGGVAVGGYHEFNLAIHGLAALVLFGVVRRTLRFGRVAPALGRDSTWIAGGVAVLWAAHPLQTESVTYTIQRAESLMGLFYLGTLYGFIRSLGDDDAGGGPRARAWLALSCVACLLGMATKEVMVTAPVLVLLYDRTFGAGTFRAALQRRGRYYAVLAATWIVLALLVISAEGRGGTAGVGTKISVPAYALTQCHAVVHYLRLAFWPAPLVFDYGTETFTSFAAVGGPAILLLALLVGTMFALRARPPLGFLGAWFFAILAPTSSVVPIATQTMAEHRMYLPLAAVMALLVVALHHGLGRRAALGSVVLAAVGLVGLTIQRNETYRDPLTLWADTAAKAPHNARAHNNLGLALGDAGRLPESIAAFEAALRLDPRYADAHSNLGAALTQLGRVAEALPHYEEVLRLDPNHAEARNNYGNALRLTGRFDEAIAQFEAALRLDPGYLEAHNNLGIVLAQTGRTIDAIAQLELALRINPASAETHSNLALALAQSGRAGEALGHFAEAVRLRPTDPAMLDWFGFALLNAGRLTEAITQFEAALRLDPASAGAHHHLGIALAQAGRAAEALAQLERAAQLAPGDAETHNDLGVALALAGRIEEALRHYEEAVRLRPDFAEAARNRDRARAQLFGR